MQVKHQRQIKKWHAQSESVTMTTKNIRKTNRRIYRHRSALEYAVRVTQIMRGEC